MVRNKSSPPKAWVKHMFVKIQGSNMTIRPNDIPPTITKIWDDLSPFRKREIRKTFGGETKRVDPTQPGGLATNVQAELQEGLKQALGDLYGIGSDVTNAMVQARGEMQRKISTIEHEYWRGYFEAHADIKSRVEKAIAKAEVRMQYAIAGSKKELRRGLEHRREIEEIQVKKPKEIGGKVDIPIEGMPVGFEGKFKEKSAIGNNDDIIDPMDRTDPKVRHKQRFERL